MSANLQLKHICSQFPSAGYAVLRELDEADPQVIDIKAIDAAIFESVSDRFAFAEELLDAANRELSHSPSTFNVGARDAVSRAYYALHHVCRAIVLYVRRYDSQGHPAAISAFADIVKDEKFLQDKLGSTAHVEAELTDFRLRRNDADYHIYGSISPSQLSVDFRASGTAVCARARTYIDAAKDFVEAKVAGSI